MKELKPCPFCGEKAKIFHVNPTGYKVGCITTDCVMLPPTKEEVFTNAFAASSKWNDRKL